jgi:MoaA/NifB/PqqE/SkfB family radical SAM enzyme
MVRNERVFMKIQPPFMVSYSITTKCNLKCKHCYSDSIEQASPDELPTDEAFRLLDDLSGWGIGLLIIDGGEPLCREDLLDVVKYASSKGVRTTIGSNGTLIDEAMARKMLEAGVMSVAISVDAADAETHDSFRGISGAFEQTFKGIEACRVVGLPFQFNMVIRKENLSQLEDMLRLAVDSGANAAEFFDLVAAGRAKQECQEQALSLVERQRAMTWLAQSQEDCPILIRVPACPMYPLLLQEKSIHPRHFPAQMLQRIPYYGRGCAAGMPRGYVMIKANGEVNPCMLLQIHRYWLNCAGESCSRVSVETVPTGTHVPVVAAGLTRKPVISWRLTRGAGLSLSSLSKGVTAILLVFTIHTDFIS